MHTRVTPDAEEPGGPAWEKVNVRRNSEALVYPGSFPGLGNKASFTLPLYSSSSALPVGQDICLLT